MSRKLKTYLVVIGGGFLLFFAMLAWSAFGPARQLVVSRETTYLISPLTADGKVDYVGEILRQRKSDVTPENNAAIPLLLSTWPGELSPSEQSQMCQELGFPLPTQVGLEEIYDSPFYRKLITEWASEKWGVDLSDSQKYQFHPEFYLDDANILPWRREQLPPLAQWVDSQQTNLDRLHRITSDSKFDLPGIIEGASDNAQLLSNYHRALPIRTAARALVRRANMYAGERQPQLAWNDLKTAFVIARLYPQSPSGDDLAMSSAVEAFASGQLCQLISYGDCDGSLLNEMERFFAELKPSPTTAEIAQDFERPLTLYNAAYHIEDYFVLFDRTPPPPTPGPIQLLKWPYDKNTTLQRINQAYDRILPILQIEQPADFARAAQQLEADLTQNAEAWNQWRWSAAATLNQSTRGVYIADVTHAGWSIANCTYKEKEFRARQNFNLLLVTIALAKYQAAHGEYPPTLNEIATRIDPTCLEDIYLTGKLLRYERRGEGFLLYSRFVDGTDNGGDSGFNIRAGEWQDAYESYPGDAAIDLVVRFPMPTSFELEKPLTIAEEQAWTMPTDE